MKKIIYWRLFLLPIYVLMIGCDFSGIGDGLWSEGEYVPPPPVTPCQIDKFDEEMTDSRDGQVYGVVNINGTYWMAENLNYKTDDSWCYDDDPDLGEIYGRLYTSDAARQACPDGWRLPTDEEWVEMIKYFDPDYVDTLYSARSTIAFDRLTTCSNNGFNAQMGGYRYGNHRYSQMGHVGYYWSGTDIGPGYTRFYWFESQFRWLWRGTMSEPKGYSCRCIKDGPFGYLTTFAR